AALHFDYRRLVGANLRTARSRTERSRFRRADDVVDLVVETQAGERLFRLAGRGERPDQLVGVLEAGGHRHAEDEAIAPRQEVRGLSLIGFADVEAVLGAASPMLKLFSGPTGTSSSSSQLRFM